MQLDVCTAYGGEKSGVGEGSTGGRLCCMRARRASAMAQVAGTCGTTGGRKREAGRYHENGARGATSRALKFSLCKHGSRHASHKTRQRYLDRVCLATGKRHSYVYTYTCTTYTCVCCLRDRSALHASEFASERRPDVVASRCLFERVRNGREFLRARARARVLIG